MPIFNDELGNIFHTEGSDILWSTTRTPAKLMPSYAVTVLIDISYPDFSKSNAYGLDVLRGTLTNTACVSYASINPQEWDSGLSLVATVPSDSNYFEVQVELTRIVTPSSYLGKPFPKSIGDGYRHLLDGGSLELERIGPIIRIARFERSGNGIYLRLKQSVKDAGNQGMWTPGNSQSTGAGGYLEGWTYGGSPNAWPAYIMDSKAFGNINKRRGESNACSLSDPSDYSSVWRGTVIITPGYIKP